MSRESVLIIAGCILLLLFVVCPALYYLDSLRRESGTTNDSLSDIKINQSEELPSGWIKLHDNDDRVYYQNNITKQTQWTQPLEEGITSKPSDITVTETLNQVELEISNTAISNQSENITKTSSSVVVKKKLKGKSSKIVAKINKKNQNQTNNDKIEPNNKPTDEKKNDITDWSNNDIINWVNNLKLSQQWKQITIDAITKHGSICTGADLERIKSKKDIKQLFGINNPMLNSRLWIELKKLKSQTVPKIEETYAPKWKTKRMRKWSNGALSDWIKHMNLKNKWNDKILNVIELNQCVGEDIVELESIDEVCEAFELDTTNNKELGKKMYNEIKNFEPILKGNNEMFRINIFNNNEHLILDEEVSKTDTVMKIKTLYKIQKRIDFDVKHIHFKYKQKELFDNNILQQIGIINEKHLIEVELDDVFAITINAQGKNLVLREKVTKDYTIQQMKRMYKQQSGVYANIDEIQFYKQHKLLQSYMTLEECGIVDDKHLINVKFEADAGGNNHL